MTDDILITGINTRINEMRFDGELLHRDITGYNVEFSFKIGECWFDSETSLDIDENTTINEIKTLVEEKLKR